MAFSPLPPPGTAHEGEKYHESSLSPLSHFRQRQLPLATAPGRSFLLLHKQGFHPDSLLSGKLFTQKTPRIAPIVVFCSNRVAL